MDLPELPSECQLGSDETKINQWDFSWTLTKGPVQTVLARFFLSNRRIVVLNLATARRPAAVMGRLFGGRRSAQFFNEMDKWHVMLNAELKGLPEPRLGLVALKHEATLPTRHALIIGERHFWVSEGLTTEEMLAGIREQWRRAQPLGSRP